MLNDERIDYFLFAMDIYYDKRKGFEDQKFFGVV